MPAKPVIRITVTMDPELYAAAQAALEGGSMNALLLNLLRQYLRNDVSVLLRKDLER